MKTLKTLLFTFPFTNSMLVVAQTPELLNFQTVISDIIGDILANQNVSFRISILETSW
jgi:hypothetical protein